MSRFRMNRDFTEGGSAEKEEKGTTTTASSEDQQQHSPKIKLKYPDDHQKSALLVRELEEPIAR